MVGGAFSDRSIRQFRVASGFAIESLRETTVAALAFGARSRAVVEAGGKPPHRAVALILGALAEEAIANSGRGLKDRSAVPIELIVPKDDNPDCHLRVVYANTTPCASRVATTSGICARGHCP